MLSDISKIRSTHTYTPEVQAPFFISWVPNHLIFLAGTHLFSMAVPTTSWVDIHIYTLSPILIEVKNGCVWKVTILLDEPTFNFHAYGRKCNNTWQKVQVHWNPPNLGEQKSGTPDGRPYKIPPWHQSTQVAVWMLPTASREPTRWSCRGV